MTLATAYEVRVMVTDAWDTVRLRTTPERTVRAIKEEALARTRQGGGSPDRYQVKFRGALVLDEARTLADLAVPPDGVLIVLPAGRRPVR
jgi:hypothetical protein